MDPAKREAAHARLLDEIARNARETAHWTGRAAFSEAIVAAMARVPRHRFVKPEQEPAA
jgi:protein-L-isoaspartate O-methyltransferase